MQVVRGPPRPSHRDAMKLNFLFYNARNWDGYGRYSARLIQALESAHVEVFPHFEEALNAPQWMQEWWGIDWSNLTISCLPPYFLQKSPGRHWLLTMTEGSECPDGWADIINESGVEHVIVPCQHNADAFARGGVTAPITVIPGGTDPDEFPLRNGVVREYSESRREYSESTPRIDRPYTFLALADRGSRKGWDEVYQAFYMAFGGKTDGVKDVRLIIKCRPEGNDLLEMIATAKDLDPRLCIQIEDVADVAQVYAQADCFVIPSRSEGWGMPHREAAMMGIPVITQAYSGMDDGHTHEWATTVKAGHMERIPSDSKGHIKGEWQVCDIDHLAKLMRDFVAFPNMGISCGRNAAAWLRKHQTWDHSAQALLQVMQQEGVFEDEYDRLVRLHQWH